MAEIQNNPQTQGELSAKFVEFVMMQTQNILFLLGRLATPDGRSVKPDFETARVFIDHLEMIEHKTAGNLSGEESAVLKNALQNVRFAFVEAINETQQASSKSGSTPSPAASSVETTTPAPPPPSTAPPSEEEENKKRFTKKYG